MLTEEPSMEEIIAIMSKEIREESREEGLEQGREEGHEQASMQIAKNLLAEGSTHEFIHKITGLSLDVIKNLDS
jgi:predicted transposase/invertase (TIGR01784 family)